ncbi:glycosyltransferase family 4 protein [Haloarcula sp. CBA1122]|uniref:glycosyltransferase family 4 protein n=1 Tax=Haloarcula sp. CBA1122 TaxID=2668069 RepID=UPI0018D216D3|nr:glycosyltransferase family 4 protein [Haloarcula sp. CBA1122]
MHVYKKLSFGGTAKSVELFFRHHDTALFDVRLRTIDGLGARGKRLQSNGYDIESVNSVEALHRRLQRDDIDIVHVHGSFERGDEVITAAHQENTPAIFKSTHFGMEEDGDLSDLIDKYIYISKFIFLRYLYLNEIPLQHPHWESNHRVLYNPLNTQAQPSAVSDMYRKKFEIPKSHILIGKVGRAVAAKWGKITLRAFERLLRERSDVHLLLGNPPEEIRSKVDQLGMSDNVYYVNDIPLGEMYHFYDSIDILAHSSRMGETFGYVMAEAMLRRTPVVVNSQPMRDNGQLELIRNDVTGYVTGYIDPYLDALKTLIDDDTTRKSMGRRARTSITTRFDASRLTRRLERIYVDELMDIGVLSASNPASKYRGAMITDMVAFDAEYHQRLRELYGGTSMKYELERLTWEGIKRLPRFRMELYKIASSRGPFIE